MLLKLSKRMTCALAILAIGVMALVSSNPVWASDTTLPEEFYGEILINGLPAPEGTEISAFIGNSERGSLVTADEGKYGGSETFSPRLIVEGQANDIGRDIDFYINNHITGYSTVFTPGQVTELNLSTQDYPMDIQDGRIEKALTYLKDSQEPDGSVDSYVVTSWVIMAVAAAGQDPHDWKSGNNSLVSYFENNSQAYVDPDLATDCERTILAVVAAGENPRDFGNHDYVADLLDFFDGTQIGDTDRINDDCWGILALKSIGEGSDIVPQVTEYIVDNQNSNGGWNWAAGGESDADNTAAAISALIAAGYSPASGVLTAAAGYLKSQQQSNGGFISEGTTNSGVDSWTIRAISDLGQDPTGKKWRDNSSSAVQHLLNLQNTDGSFNWSASKKSKPEWMTAYAVPALLGASYPMDKLAPEISNLKPSSGSTISTKNPIISASLEDATSGIDITSIELSLDDEDVTDEAAITASKISYTADALETGTHSVKLQVSDKCGNTNSQEWTFKIKLSSGGGGGGGGGSSGTRPSPTPAPSPSSTPSATPTQEPIPTGVIADNSATENSEVSTAIRSPASFVLSDLFLSAAEYEQNDAVIIQVMITNEGDLPGSYTSDLWLDGSIVQTQVVTLSGHSHEVIEFSITAGEKGTHDIAIGELKTGYSVKPAPVQADAVISAITLNRSAFYSGEKITITASVTNPGTIPAQYAVTLNIDGTPGETQEIELEGNSSRDVVFNYSTTVPGDHTAGIGDKSVQFRIRQPKSITPDRARTASGAFSPWLTAGIVLGVLIIGGGVFLVLRKKAKH
jgi:hypothetical protein